MERLSRRLAALEILVVHVGLRIITILTFLAFVAFAVWHLGKMFMP